MKKLRFINKRIRKMWGDIRPGSLQIEVTNACNFHCKMCPFHGPEKASDRPVGFMDLKNYRQIVTEFRALGGSLVIPQGAGESFLHPDFAEMIEFSKKKMNLAIAFNTNGSRITRDMMTFLIDLNVDHIGFSVDALHPDTFRNITGNEIEPVEAAVEEMVALRQSRGAKRPRIRVLLVAQEDNMAEISAYVDRWINVADEVVIQARRTRAGRMLETSRDEIRRPCRHLFDTVFIQWDGEMVICCEDWESVTSVGNVLHEPLRDLWQGDRMRSYRQAQRDLMFSPPDICRDCQAWAGGRERAYDHGTAIETVSALTHVWRRKESA